MNKKKFLIILLVVLAVTSAAVLILSKTGKLKPRSTQPAAIKADLPPAAKYTKTDLPADKLPEDFIKGIIQEKKPVILENYEVRLEDGTQIQYTVKYITEKSLDENLESYRKYFRGDKWVILGEDKKESYAIIRAAKDMDSVTVTQNINKTDKMSVVDITLARLLLRKTENAPEKK